MGLTPSQCNQDDHGDHGHRVKRQAGSRVKRQTNPQLAALENQLHTLEHQQWDRCDAAAATCSPQSQEYKSYQCAKGAANAAARLRNDQAITGAD